MGDITPDEVLAAFWRWWKVWLTALAIIAALIIGGWRAGWWFAGQDVNRETRLIQNSNSYQTALVSQLDSEMATVLDITTQMDGVSRASQQYADLRAERLGVAREACAAGAKIIIRLSPGEHSWLRANCALGTLSPSSPLTK